jgi:hypothetical protein
MTPSPAAIPQRRQASGDVLLQLVPFQWNAKGAM